MTLDALDIFRLDKPGFCLSGGYDILKAGLLIHVKNPQGFPIDVRRYTTEWIYDQTTEGDPPEGWTDPSSVKVHIGNGGRGNRICPRWIRSFPITTSEADSPFMVIKNSQWDFVPHTVLATKYILNAPLTMPWGGDVGTVPTYKLWYQWGGKQVTGQIQVFPNLEEYFYAPPFGLVKWQSSTLVNGQYIVNGKPSLSNKLQTLADWQKTYPDLKEFSFKLPFLKG